MPTEELSLVDALVQLSFRIQGVLTAAAEEHDLTLTQLRLLGILRDRTPGAQELATLMGLEKSSLTGLLDRAERRGLVERRPAAHDGRAVEVHLTAAGRRLTTGAAARVGAQIEQLAAVLPERTRTELRRTATRLVYAA